MSYYDKYIKYLKKNVTGGNLDYTINLLWINNKKEPLGEKYHLILESLNRHIPADGHNINLFIDKKVMLDEDIKKLETISDITFMRFQKRLNILDIRDFSCFKNNEKIQRLFMTNVPVYCRVDLAKIIIAHETLKKFTIDNPGKTTYFVFTDLDVFDGNEEIPLQRFIYYQKDTIPIINYEKMYKVIQDPRPVTYKKGKMRDNIEIIGNIEIKKVCPDPMMTFSQKSLFDEKTVELLDTYGIIMAKVQGSYENGFFIMKNDREFLEALDFMLDILILKITLILDKNKNEIMLEVKKIQNDKTIPPQKKRLIMSAKESSIEKLIYTPLGDVGFTFFGSLIIYVKFLKKYVQITHNSEILSKERFLELNKRKIVNEVPVGLFILYEDLYLHEIGFHNSLLMELSSKGKSICNIDMEFCLNFIPTKCVNTPPSRVGK